MDAAELVSDDHCQCLCFGSHDEPGLRPRLYSFDGYPAHACFKAHAVEAMLKATDEAVILFGRTSG